MKEMILAVSFPSLIPAGGNTVDVLVRMWDQAEQEAKTEKRLQAATVDQEPSGKAVRVVRYAYD